MSLKMSQFDRAHVTSY